MFTERVVVRQRSQFELKMEKITFTIVIYTLSCLYVLLGMSPFLNIERFRPYAAINTTIHGNNKGWKLNSSPKKLAPSHLHQCLLVETKLRIMTWIPPSYFTIPTDFKKTRINWAFAVQKKRTEVMRKTLIFNYTSTIYNNKRGNSDRFVASLFIIHNLRIKFISRFKRS